MGNKIEQLENRIKELESENKKLKLCHCGEFDIEFNNPCNSCVKNKIDKLKEYQEFIQDCSVSHNETRYKYRAQVLIGKCPKE